MTIDKYLSVFNIGLQNTFVYRWNYFLRALFGLIPLAGTVFLWRAIFKERGGGLHGYDYSSMIYYYLLTLLVSNRLSVQHFFERPSRLHIRYAAADRVDLLLFSRLHRAATGFADLSLRDDIDLNGGVHSILHHLQPGDDGVLGPGNLDHRFHCLLVRIFPRRPNVSHRHHAGGNPGGDEMAAVLLRAVLSGCDLSWPFARRGTSRSAGNSKRLALARVGMGKRDVETRSRPLPSRGWIKFDGSP